MSKGSEQKLKNLGFSDGMIVKVQEAERIVVDLLTGEAAAIPAREPCRYEPLSGSTIFKYDPKDRDTHCKDFDLADNYVGKWIGKAYTGEPSAIDINNVACAYLWLAKPNWNKAKELFTEADEKSNPKKELEYYSIITNNKKMIDRATVSRAALPITISLKTVNVLQDVLVETGKKIETISTREIRELLDHWE